MKLWQKFKRLMPNRKKARVKKAEIFPSSIMTEAERLIMNNWGITFSNPEPARAGEKRARVREVQKMQANSKIPDVKRPHSRQVIRAAERRDFKNIRSIVKEEKRKARRNKPGMIPT